MLGDNPRDHDGQFSGLDPEISDVSGVKPDVNFASFPAPESPFKPWKIYPKPPPPHWHWKDATEPVSGSSPHISAKDAFVFEDCEIPGSHSWGFEIDEKGVYQVYGDVEGL